MSLLADPLIFATAILGVVIGVLGLTVLVLVFRGRMRAAARCSVLLAASLGLLVVVAAVIGIEPGVA